LLGLRLRSLSPEALLVGSFALVIFIGSLLLMLPWSRTAGEADYLTALFISTSAVCVTGLVVVDFPTYYTTFGQVVVLVLIQLGGLGVMTGAILLFRALGRRLSLRSQTALQDSLLQMNMAADFRRLFRWILTLTLGIEAVGALALFAGFSLHARPGDAFFPALFHAVSAFCNAGFSTFSDSLAAYRGEPLIVWSIMALIVLGGVGGPVLVELIDWAKRRRAEATRGMRRLSLHSRTVLVSSTVLIVGGTVALLLLGLTAGERGMAERVEAALFQSITARTAGFNTISIGALPGASLLLLVLLMFIGGSPGSCAGGIKTTTAAVWVSELWASLRRRDEVLLFDRGVRPAIVRRAMLLINLSVAWNFFGVLLLVSIEGSQDFGFIDLFFEQISAFGTVGLSTGVTPRLAPASQVWIIATMFLGRLGPLVLTAWILGAEKGRVRHARGEVLIG
jgi:trk system potassium uptake protein